MTNYCPKRYKNSNNSNKTGFIKKILSVCTAFLLGISLFTDRVSFTAEADTEAYPKAYTIQNVLSDYQFFVENDVTYGNHIVGGVVVGGDYSNTATFGDA